MNTLTHTYTPLDFFEKVLRIGEKVWQCRASRTDSPFISREVVIERGWLWLPKYSDFAFGTNGVACKAALNCIGSVIRAAGGKWSQTRHQFFHVGTGWAPEERVLSPKPGLWSEEDVQGAWTEDTGIIDVMTRIAMAYEDIHSSPSSVHTLNGYHRNMMEDGLLFISIRRKPRVARPDPTLAILRAGGLLV